MDSYGEMKIGDLRVKMDAKQFYGPVWDWAYWQVLKMLPVYERVFRGDVRVRKALQVAFDYFNSGFKSDPEEVSLAQAECWTAFQVAIGVKFMPAAHLAFAVSSLCLALPSVSRQSVRTFDDWMKDAIRGLFVVYASQCGVRPETAMRYAPYSFGEEYRMLEYDHRLRQSHLAESLIGTIGGEVTIERGDTSEDDENQ